MEFNNIYDFRVFHFLYPPSKNIGGRALYSTADAIYYSSASSMIFVTAACNPSGSLPPAVAKCG